MNIEFPKHELTKGDLDYLPLWNKIKGNFRNNLRN